MLDDELESAHSLFLQRVRNGEVSEKAARSIPEAYKWRLDFLQTLLQKTAELEEFSGQRAEVNVEVEEQAREIQELERVLAEPNINPAKG